MSGADGGGGACDWMGLSARLRSSASEAGAARLIRRPTFLACLSRDIATR